MRHPVTVHLRRAAAVILAALGVLAALGLAAAGMPRAGAMVAGTQSEPVDDAGRAPAARPAPRSSAERLGTQ